MIPSLADGFDRVVPDGTLQLYRLLLGVAVLWKAAATALAGDWSRFAAGSFGRYVLDRRWGPTRARLLAAAHRPLVVARAVAGALLIAGVAPKAAVVVAVVGFLHELTYEYRFNTIYVVLCLLCLLPAGRLGDPLELATTTSAANTWSQVLVVLVTTDLYWNSAYQKLRSPQFLSGLSLAQQAHVAQRVRHRLPLREYVHPRLDTTGVATGAVRLPWRLMALAVVALEAVLPLGLLVPVTRPAAVAAGVVLHLAFLAILPLRLMPFTVAVLASYLLFAT